MNFYIEAMGPEVGVIDGYMVNVETMSELHDAILEHSENLKLAGYSGFVWTVYKQSFYSQVDPEGLLR